MSIRKRKILTTLPRSDRPCVSMFATLEMILSLPTSMIKTPAEGFEAVYAPESIGYTKDARAAPIPVLSSEGRLASYDLSCDRILCDGAIAVIE
jgi:hypothetical protein